MKVAVILGTFPKASERFISREIFELRRQGVDLRIFALSPGEKRDFSEIEIKEINAALPEYQPALWSPRVLPLKLYYLLKKGGALASLSCATIRRTGLLGWLPAGFRMRGVFHFARVIETEGIDLIHAHFMSLPALCGAFVSALTGKPLVVSAHARDIFVPEPYFDLVARRAKKIICCHRYGANLLRSRGIDAAVIRHGLKLEHERLTRSVTAPLSLISGGRFVEKKGFGTLIETLKALRDGGTAAELTIVGDGPLRPRLEEKARELGIARYVTFTGWIPTEAFHQKQLDSDVFVMAPREAANGDRDGIPNVLLEAMVHKLPVVTNDFTAVPEIARHEETALVVKSGRAEDFAAAIMRLTDEALTRRLTAGAYRMLTEEFDIVKNVGKLIEAFEAAAP